jgi:phosphatidate cytidylyltransferase
MGQRVLSAAVLVPVVLGVFLLGRPALDLGLAAVAGLAAWEIAALQRRAGAPAVAWLVVAAATAAALAMGRDDTRPYGPFMPAVAAIGGALVAFRLPDVRAGFASWSATVFGASYASLFAASVGVLGVAPEAAPLDAVRGAVDWLGEGRSWLLVLVLTVWSFDTFAYLAGRAHGRGRFLQHISPRKTWSGVIGGTLAAVLVCGTLVAAVAREPLAGALLGLALAVAAQSGDVAESLLKRAAGVKDSGTLIPGHGGVLDRIDSFLFAAPVMFLALLVSGGPSMLAAVGP